MLEALARFADFVRFRASGSQPALQGAGSPRDFPGATRECAEIGGDEQWRRIIVHVERGVRQQQLPGELHSKARRMIGALDYEITKLVEELSSLMPQDGMLPLAKYNGGTPAAASPIIRLAA